MVPPSSKIEGAHLDSVVYTPSGSSSSPLVPPLFDKLFFESTPELQDLSISKMTNMVENLVESLRCCLSLQRLTINRSPSPKFIQSFNEEIQDQGFLPNLAYISIRSSWVAEVGMSYTELKEHSRASRPGLDFQGDDLMNHSLSTSFI
ncbi:hypothetical protein CPB86DRAFT_625991 [Serendipita vermifera]|nr:hypothetical protein CPB86DRAFT_625991 [Serendipita vermifera]